DRLRPILMTTAALVAGMIPVAIGQGAGDSSVRAIALVVIGGQTLCLLITLLFTPVAFSLFDDAENWFRNFRKRENLFPKFPKAGHAAQAGRAAIRRRSRTLRHRLAARASPSSILRPRS